MLRWHMFFPSLSLSPSLQGRCFPLPARWLTLCVFLSPSVTMWAACCNWFCLHGQPEDIQHRSQQGSRNQAYANAGYSSFPSPTGAEQNCKSCGVRFSNSSLKVSEVWRGLWSNPSLLAPATSLGWSCFQVMLG